MKMIAFQLIKSIILICFSIGIILKIYLLRVIKKTGTDITQSMALYLKIYMYLSIISIIIELNVYMNISSELIFIYYLIRALSSYCIVKIILVEILKTPQEYLYKNLVKKSEELEATILELKKTIDDKNIIYKDYEKRTKHINIILFIYKLSTSYTGKILNAEHIYIAHILINKVPAKNLLVLILFL